MTIQTQILASATLAIATALAAFGAAARAQETPHARAVGETHAVTLNVGSKHMVSYFIAANGACDVTLMVGDAATPEGDGGSIGTRVKFVVPSGMLARTDTAEGKSLEIACAPGAKSMSIRPVDLMVYVAPLR
jgi:hypothetical protein